MNEIKKYLDDILKLNQDMINKLSEYHIYSEEENSLIEYYPLINRSLVYLFRIRDFIVDIQESLMAYN